MDAEMSEIIVDFLGKNPRKISPIDFNRSEITFVVVLVWNYWSSCRVNMKVQNFNYRNLYPWTYQI